jgi:hypothetical protein
VFQSALSVIECNMFRVSFLKLATPNNTDKWRCMRCAEVCMLCKGKKLPAGESNFIRIQGQFCSAKIHIFHQYYGSCSSYMCVFVVFVCIAS